MDIHLPTDFPDIRLNVTIHTNRGALLINPGQGIVISGDLNKDEEYGFMRGPICLQYNVKDSDAMIHGANTGALGACWCRLTENDTHGTTRM